MQQAWKAGAARWPSSTLPMPSRVVTGACVTWMAPASPPRPRTRRGGGSTCRLWWRRPTAPGAMDAADAVNMSIDGFSVRPSSVGQRRAARRARRSREFFRAAGTITTVNSSEWVWLCDSRSSSCSRTARDPVDNGLAGLLPKSFPWTCPSGAPLILRPCVSLDRPSSAGGARSSGCG